eukprot:12035886-Ditylum_brightwellii.AAC.1
MIEVKSVFNVIMEKITNAKQDEQSKSHNIPGSSSDKEKPSNLVSSKPLKKEARRLVPAQVLGGKRRGKIERGVKQNRRYGDKLTKEKDEGVLRIYFQNISGGLKEAGWVKYVGAMKQPKAFKADIICFAKTNLA